MAATLMAPKRGPDGDTIRTRTVTVADLEALCGKFAMLHDRLAGRIKEMNEHQIRSVRFDGGGMGSAAASMLAAFSGKLGEAIEKQI